MIVFERMANGLTRCYDRRSGLSACYDTATGAYRHGDLRTIPAARIIAGA